MASGNRAKSSLRKVASPVCSLRNQEPTQRDHTRRPRGFRHLLAKKFQSPILIRVVTALIKRHNQLTTASSVIESEAAIPAASPRCTQLGSKRITQNVIALAETQTETMRFSNSFSLETITQIIVTPLRSLLSSNLR